jgi:hypothetical protein
MSLRYRDGTTKLHKLATASGQTVEEYLIEHPEYKLGYREMQKWGHKVMKLAERRIEEQRAAHAFKPK